MMPFLWHPLPQEKSGIILTRQGAHACVTVPLSRGKTGKSNAEEKQQGTFVFFYIRLAPFNTVYACIWKGKQTQELHFPRFISVIAQRNWRKLLILRSSSLFLNKSENKNQSISLCKLKCAEQEAHAAPPPPPHYPPPPPPRGEAAVGGCSFVSRMCVSGDVSNRHGSGTGALSSLMLTNNKMQSLSGKVMFFHWTVRLSMNNSRYSHGRELYPLDQHTRDRTCYTRCSISALSADFVIYFLLYHR